MTTRDEDDEILQAAEFSPFKPAREIREAIGVQVSRTTVRPRLHSEGFTTGHLRKRNASLMPIALPGSPWLRNMRLRIWSFGSGRCSLTKRLSTPVAMGVFPYGEEITQGKGNRPTPSFYCMLVFQCVKRQSPI